MTVCLAALCVDDDKVPFAVVAADRMVTLGGFMEFEHAIPKMAEPSPAAVVMIAGDTLVGTRLAVEVARTTAGTQPRTADMAAALSQHYEAVRRESMEQELLRPRGLDLTTFYANHANLSPQITMMLDQQMAQHNLGVELLLAGVDDNGGHVFTIHNPGGPELQHDVIGYAATGSGAIHAVQSMVGFGHHAGASAKDTLFRVYASKRRAEVAPGVGHDTDLGVVSSTGTRWLDSDQIGQLSAMYESFEDSTQESLTEKLAELTLEVLDADEEDRNDAN